MRKIEPLANDYIKVYESDIEGKSEYCYTPGICVLKSGRIIATLDHTYPGISPKEKGMIYISDDGEHFRFVGYFPFQHARPFEAGRCRIYYRPSGQCAHYPLRRRRRNLERLPQPDP